MSTLVVPVTSTACVRFQRQPNEPAQLDGPGSFGALQDTVTLDCLRFVGSVTQRGREVVLIQDERGTVHHLSLGDYMGENTGKIVKIDKRVIVLRQVVERNGEWVEQFVEFPRN
ncbi:pilus assembly protein PilP [Rhizobacter sp. Root1238]|uniref:pilus assembly protein PilP n=1 Tax=Rhizobacter sp. Root1238 TaxID=1736435 RepID=UPI00138F0580|nr:pilus assembly protein PilP [Rhizobacter sp. Root1238]